MKTQKSLKDVINSMIKAQLDKINVLELFTVTGVNESTQTLNVKQMNINLQFDGVIFSGLGLGNAKGQLLLPSVNDIVIGAFLHGSNKPIIIGSLYDTFTQLPDNKNSVKTGEYLLMPVANGSYLFINQAGDIIFKNKNGKYFKLLIALNGIQSSSYYSNDGTEGVTANVTITEDGGGTKTLSFKNGIFVGSS